MQDNIQKIIAVLNDFSMIDEVLAKTFTFAQKHDATIEILYVHESPLFDVPDLFCSDTEENSIDKAKIKASIEEKVNTYNTEKQVVVFVQIDDTENRVWALAREENETLIITGYHKDITENILRKIKQAVLVVKTDTEAYNKIALVVDTVGHGKNCIGTVKRHFPQSDVALFYDYRYIVDPNMEAAVENTMIIEEAQREAFDTLKSESGLKGAFFIDGVFSDTQMSEYVQENGFDMLFVCSQADDFFISDTLAITLLDTLSCDMLVSSR